MSKKRDKACANGKKNQAGTKKLKIMDTVLEKPEEEIIQADFALHLRGVLQCISMLDDEFMRMLMGWSERKGALFHGKPGLGLRAQKYLEVHGKDITTLFPRHVATMTAKTCDDTFKRAACCAPCIILLMGLEDAAPEVEAVIARRMNDIWDSNTFTHVLGMTAMYGKVSEKLRNCFAVTDLEELVDSAHQD